LLESLPTLKVLLLRSSDYSLISGVLPQMRESARYIPVELVQRGHGVGIGRFNAETRQTVQKAGTGVLPP
jgi:hypothetical protein